MGKTAVVFIDGEIRPPSDEYWGYNNIAGIRSQIEWQGQFDDIEVTINSCGGDIAEGLGIYDLLRSYGKPITTVVIGQCCSAATIVFLSGKSRIIYENVVAFMVHKASGGGTGTADELRKIADFIDSYNERMATVYAEATGRDTEVVAEWLSNGDLFMTAQEALDNGFATAIAKPIEAKMYASRPATTPAPVTPPTASAPTAIPTTDQSTLLMKIIFDKTDRIVASVKAMSSGVTAVAEVVKTTSGDELSIDRFGDSIAEGDPVTKGGETAPDGEYTLENGAKITVKDGKVETINTDGVTDATAKADAAPKAAAETTVTASGDDSATLKAENERLMQENESLKTQVSGFETRIGTVEAKMVQMSGLMGTTQSQPVPTGATNNTQRPNPVTARNGANGTDTEDEDRQAMLNDRKNRGKGATATA